MCFHLGNTIEAHSFIDESITRAIEVDGENSWAHGIALEDKAAILLHMDVPAAIGLFKKAIETITLANRPETEEEVAKLYLELANIFKSQNDDKEQLSALYQRYKVM